MITKQSIDELTSRTLRLCGEWRAVNLDCGPDSVPLVLIQGLLSGVSAVALAASKTAEGDFDAAAVVAGQAAKTLRGIAGHLERQDEHWVQLSKERD